MAFLDLIPCIRFSPLVTFVNAAIIPASFISGLYEYPGPPSPFLLIVDPDTLFVSVYGDDVKLS